MCCASQLQPAVDAAPVGVFAFVGPGGTPISCAVTPYLHGDDIVVTSTLALVGKVGALLRDDRAALLAGGVEARGHAAIRIEDDGKWFDQIIREQELRKYPPARPLLRLPWHRRLLWWYVGRAVISLPAAGLGPAPGPDRVSVAGIERDGLLRILPVSAEIEPDRELIDLDIASPDGPACVLVHEESAGMADLRQLRLRGRLVSGRLHVEDRSGSLAPQSRGVLDPLNQLRVLGSAARANRPRLERWKSRLTEEQAHG